jgi:hypothetical protein
MDRAEVGAGSQNSMPLMQDDNRRDHRQTTDLIYHLAAFPAQPTRADFDDIRMNDRRVGNSRRNFEKVDMLTTYCSVADRCWDIAQTKLRSDFGGEGRLGSTSWSKNW